MKKQNLSIIIAIFTLAIFLVPTVGAVPSNHGPSNSGTVYIMTNDPSGNQVVIYDRAADGSLTWVANVATGGLGMSGLTGNNQGGLLLSTDGRWLFVVNAGSNDFSVFRVSHGSLTLTDRESSGGVGPVSVADFGNWVYVLNQGSSETAGNIAGFYLNDKGQLSPIAGSVQLLSGPGVTVAQISFNPTGTALAVTEKSTSLIDIYSVDSHGVASSPVTNISSGSTPFGFAFDRKGTLIVSEAAGGPAGTSAVSSYSINSIGTLTTISASVPDTGLAACWLVVTGNSRYAYTDNAHGGTISSYTVGPNGSLTLLQADAANTVAGNLDMALTRNSNLLYIFVHGSNSIEGFHVNHDGTLTLLTTTSGVPTTADGLAAN
jgi:6-phosphogluconolactonase